MRNLFIALAVCTVVTVGSSLAIAGFDKGVAAYERGDYATALKEFRVLAEQGDATAQFILGVMYHDGRGVTQDYKEAVKWHRKAADQGNALAQFNLGVMYGKAAHPFTRACVHARDR